VIRHLYLDFDNDGTRSLELMRGREDMPKPNYIVNTSPGHWQVSWKVQGFGKEQAEEVMRGLVREFGADPAATDSSRVLRIPGFVNHKRRPPHRVRAERLATEVYSPHQFPRLAQEGRHVETRAGDVRSARTHSVSFGRLSQSELDWAYARRSLSRGEPPEAVAAAIADYRRGEKPDPEYYARLTVQKAVRSLTDTVITERPELER
jgi:hypothetical protein